MRSGVDAWWKCRTYFGHFQQDLSLLVVFALFLKPLQLLEELQLGSHVRRLLVVLFILEQEKTATSSLSSRTHSTSTLRALSSNALTSAVNFWLILSLSLSCD